MGTAPARQPDIIRHRTAIGRTDLSRPMRITFESGLIQPGGRVFDYGCGRGDDIRHLGHLDIEATGWDPAHRPDAEVVPADIVNLGYVVNVIENPSERQEALQKAWRLAQRVLVVSARLTLDENLARKETYLDGCVTSRDTFQKFYTQTELREWIDESLEVVSVAAAPGIFLVFRDEELRQTYLASRYRRRRATPRQRLSDMLYETHRELLQPLINFVTDRGRLPMPRELAEEAPIAGEFGSIPRAFAIIRRVTGPEQWDQIRLERYHELLIYFALDRLSGRPRFSDLPPDLRYDVREYFSNYKQACEFADRLLFSAGNSEILNEAMKASPIGKLMPNALYVHIDALPHLPPILRVYEGCARSYLGQVDDANVIKLGRDKSKVSYLSYPKFEKDPHPSLAEAYSVKLGSLKVWYRNYRESENPPILHRKEEFVPKDDPNREKYVALTRQEERRGLYDETDSIGLKGQWESLLESKGVRLRGHRVVRR
jgi:DNA phosphorothioation-associated putative methyltransferase